MIGALKPKGVRVPDGFATTAEAYWRYVRENRLDEKIKAEIGQLKAGSKSLPVVGKALRTMDSQRRFPEGIEEAIREAYRERSSPRSRRRRTFVTIRCMRHLYL